MGTAQHSVHSVTTYSYWVNYVGIDEGGTTLSQFHTDQIRHMAVRREWLVLSLLIADS